QYWFICSRQGWRSRLGNRRLVRGVLPTVLVLNHREQFSRAILVPAVAQVIKRIRTSYICSDIHTRDLVNAYSEHAHPEFDAFEDFVITPPALIRFPTDQHA